MKFRSLSPCTPDLVEGALLLDWFSEHLPEVPLTALHSFLLQNLGMNAALAVEQSGSHKYSLFKFSIKYQ
jgi:hypothetical protein